MRRTIKPFTVEVRSSRRKPQSASPVLEDQPAVEWPAALRELLPQPAPLKPAGRILPALQLSPEPAAPTAVAADPIDDRDAEPDSSLLAESEHGAVDFLTSVDKTAPAAPIKRLKRTRRPRAEFARGERWKARLPGVVHAAWRRSSTATE